MSRTNRPDDLLAVALEAFQERGFEATSVADIVDALGTSNENDYSLVSKEQLLAALVEPLLDDIDQVLARYPRHPSWPGDGSRLLSRYLDVLIAHRDLVAWIDADTAVLHHPAVGKRLAESNQWVRAAIRGDNRSSAALLGASGAMWRPLRNLTELDAQPEREEILAAALAVVATVRSS